MPELHSNGNYQPYLAELFNPLAGVGQFNAGAGVLGGIGVGQQNPLTGQAIPQTIGPWQQPQQVQAQAQAVVQIAQQIAAKQAVQALHTAQALQALQQLVQSIVAQQQGVGLQQPFAQGVTGVFGANPITQAYGLSGLGQGFGIGQGYATPNPIAQAAQQQAQQQQAVQQQAMQQLQQYLSAQQPNPFRYGLAA